MEPKFEVVISGISGRFPECDDVETFRGKLFNRENLMTVDDRKWPTDYKYEAGQIRVPPETGKYIDPSAIDIRVFKLSDKYGRSQSVQNRKSAETTFEAIADAGVNPYSLDGCNVGVFGSCGIAETDIYGYEDGKTSFLLIGGAKTMQANRISYAFNFTGPSYTFHSDILGDIEALRAAYTSLSRGLIEAAVVVVSTYITDPHITVNFMGMKLVSPDGTNRVFNKYANGFARSEGTVSLFLQKSTDAKRNYGTIELCESLYPGFKSTSLVGYNSSLLANFLDAIYKNEKCQTVLAELPFLELSAHGKKDHDETEICALFDVIRKYKKTPLLVGSIVSNIGHTEAAAPYMSLLKAIFTLDVGHIIPNINLTESCDQLDSIKNNEKVQVVENEVPLNGNSTCVNVLGLSGYMGNVILKQNPRAKTKTRNDNLPRLLLICGRSEEKLKEIVKKIQSMPFDEEFIHLANDVFRSSMPLHTYRGYTILPKTITSAKDVQERGDTMRPIWFIFSGMGSQWNGMGRSLLKIPVFAMVIERCDRVLRPKGVDIYEVLTSSDTKIFDNIINSFVGIISVQIGLVEVLKVLKIRADGIIGHSVGENACAYADGCLTLEQAVLASYERGKASVDARTIKGMMAAVGRGYNDIKGKLPPNVEVACHNSAQSCTLSGPADDIERYVRKLKRDGFFAKAVNVANIAYHSKNIAPAAPLLLNSLSKEIRSPKKRSSKWISTSFTASNWHQPLAQYCSPEYLTNNLLNPVLFEEGCKHIPNKAVLIEIAPCGLLQSILRKSFPEACTTHISLTVKSSMTDDIDYFLSAVGKLYIAGYEPHINALFPDIAYPVSRETPSISPLCSWIREELGDQLHLRAIKAEPESRTYIPINIREDSEFSFLNNYKRHNQIIAPLSLFLVMVLRRFSSLIKKKIGSYSVLFQNVKLHKNLNLIYTEDTFVSITIQRSGAFEVCHEEEFTGFSVIVTGTIIEYSFEERRMNVQDRVSGLDSAIINAKDIREIFSNVGYELKAGFDLIKMARFGAEDYVGNITWNGNWVTFLESLINFHILGNIKRRSTSYYPSKIGKIILLADLFDDVQKESQIVCSRNLTLDKTVCDGIEICHVECKVLPSPRKRTSVNLKTPESTSESKVLETYILKNSFRNKFVNIQYYILHKEDRIMDADNEENQDKGVYGISYSGTTKSGRKVMGVALNEVSGNPLKLDPDLIWNIPDNWNLEHATTLPLAHMQAYYLLHKVLKCKRHRSVFINMGKELHLVAVCILTLLQWDTLIFISLTNDEESNWIQEKYKMCENIVLLDQTNYKYELQLMAHTSGRGVDIVLNCVPGMKHVTASMNCLGEFSCYMQLGQHNYKDENYLGLYKFLKSTSFTIFPQKISNFACLPSSEKRVLKERIELGIKKGVVTPLCTAVHEMNLGSNANVRKVREDMTSTPSLHLNGNNSCVIIGNGKNTSWLQIIDWLASKGVCKFFVALNYTSLRSSITRHINRIVNNNKVCNIVLAPLRSKYSMDDITKMIVDIHKFSAIEGVFVVSMDSKIVRYLDLALRQLKSPAHLISLFSGGLDCCESRRNSGYPGTVIHSDDTNINLTPVLHDLHTLLNGHNNNVPTVLEVAKKTVSFDAHARTQLLEYYFPKNIQILAEFGADIPHDLLFKEVPSLSPRYCHTKGITPIFVIPTVHQNHLKLIVAKLIHPVFCATVSYCSDSIKQMALKLFNNLVTLQPTGAITLVGETWNSIIAIEIASLLQENARPYRLFLIEGNPVFWYERCQQFINSSGTEKLDNRILSNLVKNNVQIAEKSPLPHELVLEKKSPSYLSQLNIDDDDTKSISQITEVIRNQLIRVSEHQYVDKVLRNVTIFQQNLYNDYPIKISVTSEFLKVSGATYEDFLSNNEIANTINTKAAFTWWD